MSVELVLVPCLQDNYAVLVHDPVTGATAVIDAPEAAPIEAALDRAGYRLTDILVTHHHGDHTGGIAALKKRFACRVVAPAAEAPRIPAVDETVREGDTVRVGNLAAEVIETPGHTAGHISYWFAGEKLAFVGDTLFSLGCGRLLEGDAPTMWRSLSKLKRLPDDTRVYCGHEYTMSNARFALGIDPDNTALRKRAAVVDLLRNQGQPTLPTELGDEKAANPFLRADDPALAAALGLAGRPPEEVFALIRKRKDQA